MDSLQQKCKQKGNSSIKELYVSKKKKGDQKTDCWKTNLLDQIV